MKFQDAVMPRDFDLGNDDYKFGCDHVWYCYGTAKDGEQFFRCVKCGIEPYELEDQDESEI